MPKLLDSDSEESDAGGLTINESYAQRYENWREKEEYQKLKDKYGENIISSASELSASDSDDSDENPTEDEEYDAQLNQQIFDEQFLKVYGALKRKDPTIYDEKTKFYDHDAELAVPKKPKSKGDSEKLTLAQYHVKLVKERQGMTEEDDAREIDADVNKRPAGYYEELGAIQDEFRAVLNEADDDDLIMGVKKTDEQLPSTSKDANIDYLTKNWLKNSKVDKADEFLRDYIVNKRYLEDNPKKKLAVAPVAVEDDDDSDDERPEDVQLPTKAAVPKYHFEEDGGTELKRFPRVVDSARDLAEPDTRALKRQAARERKKKEKAEELQRYSMLKRKQVEDRLQKLKEISGNDKIFDKEFNIDALIDDDKDFDPDKYDQYMSALFGDNYYVDSKSDNDKPQFEFVAGIDDDIEENIKSNSEKLATITAADESDASDEGEEEEDEDEETGKRGKKSKRRRKKGILSQNKLDSLPVYEDIIGDMPTRFKYRQVHSNDFGLTNDELLFADDKELNRWVSLKKTCQYRDDDEEIRDGKVYANKSKNLALKKKIFQSIYGDKKDDGSNDEDAEQSKKKKKRRPKKKNKALASEDADETTEVAANESKANEKKANEAGNEAVDKSSKSKKRKRGKKQNPATSTTGLSHDRLKAYGLSNREIKRRKL